MGALLCCGHLLTLFIVLSTANPGVKLRVTQKGLDHANDIAQRFLAQQLNNLRLDNQSGRERALYWNLTNFQNRGVTVPTSRLSFDPSLNAIAWSLTGLTINLHGDYSVNYRRGWVRLPHSGSFDAVFRGVNAQVSIRLGSGPDGRPSLSYVSCTANIGSVNLRFSRSFIGLFTRMFRGPLENSMRGLLPGQICNIVRQGVNNDGNKAMSQLKGQCGVKG